MDDVPRHALSLTRDEAMRRIASVGLGRVIFSERALPAVRLVSHIVDEGHIVFGSAPGAGIVTDADAYGTVVAYEADQIDPRTRLGWSVTVTGVARLVDDPQQLMRYRKLLTACQAAEADQAIRIDPEFIDGFELANEPSPSPGDYHGRG